MTNEEECSTEKTEQTRGFEPVGIEELPDTIRETMNKVGWTSLMSVQSASIPYILNQRDLMVQSHTGSGKTGAFLLPLLEKIDPDKPVCQALIMVPTRELAGQVIKEAELLGAGGEVRVVAVYGGVGYKQQMNALRKGAHLVVGTPGRILDHLMKGTLDLDSLQFLVFDEADRMLSMGFYPDMKQLRMYLPERRSGYMFSATLPAGVRRLAQDFLHEPEFLSMSSDSIHVAGTEHAYYEVPAMDKDRCLVRIIEVENPDSLLVFCNTKAQVNYVAQVLQRFGYDADQLTADLHQNAREKVLERVKTNKLKILVATDVAARGIDISKLSHVIQYDFPEDPESYIHRAGRTGRAGASGVAISLVNVSEKLVMKRVAAHYKIKMIQRTVPSDEDVQAVVSERTTVLLESKLRGRDRLRVERMQRFLPLGRSLGESDDELALIAMLLDDYYQQSLHAPASYLNDEKAPGGAKASARPRSSGGRSRGGKSRNSQSRGGRRRGK